jgi:hypothetical protein
VPHPYFASAIAEDDRGGHGGVIRELVTWPARAVGRRAEDLTLAALDAALASRLGAEVVDRVLTSELAGRAVSRALEGPLVDTVARDVVRFAVIERLAGAVLEDPALERVVASALDSAATERVLVRVLESRLVDEAVQRVLAGEELWIVVDEIAQSPAVTEAITRQSVSFADQVGEQLRDRSRNADARLERAARRVLRRSSASEPERP